MRLESTGSSSQKSQENMLPSYTGISEKGHSSLHKSKGLPTSERSKFWKNSKGKEEAGSLSFTLWNG